MKKILLSLLACSLALPMAAVDMTVDNLKRNYLVYVPKNLGENRPLLISCHGMNQDAGYQKDQLKIETIADTAKFVTVFPNGIDRGWDISGNRDINFVLAIIDAMVRQYKIDRNRVYLSGFSMGGMFTYHAMNRIADKIAAFAPISGYPMGGATANANVRPIPIIHTHGTSDDVVNFGGVQGSLNVWIKHNGCPTTAKVTRNYRGTNHITRHVWSPGNQGVEVVLMELKDKGHWVSNDVVFTGDEIWRFCSRYSLNLKNPTIQFTSPTNGLTYITLGGQAELPPLTLNANADDPDGQVAKVEFFDGTTLLTTLTKAPYSYTLTSLTKGVHTLKAVVTDDEGRTGSSNITITVEEPAGAYSLDKTFTTENSMPEGWASYDGAERRTGFSSGYSSGCRVFKFTGAKRDFNWGLYARNTTSNKKAGYVRFADKSTTTTLTLHPGIYELTYKVSNWNRADFSPVTVAVETTAGKEIFSNTFTPTANVGNTASNSFSGTTQLTNSFEVTEKGQYTVTFYTADQAWADLVVGPATLAYKSALPTGNQVIDISGDNTSSSYVSYSNDISLPEGKAIDVLMARYCYFSSTISGNGTLNLYAGGERDYLGTANGKTWPNWTGYTGDIHIYPRKENSSAAGFYGVVLAHGGKSSTPDNALDDVKAGKVNTSMENNRVLLHAGATICTEANTSGAGFRIGELHTEPGSTLQGYMKNQRAAYYLLGHLNTSATLAGTIAPSSYRDDTALGIVKEGSGIYTITGNNNYLSGALRIMEGRVQIANDRAEAEAKKLRGALGARPDASDPIAYVFEQGVLGGTGSIGGTVDNYGTVEPGTFQVSGDEVGISAGTLTISNYATPTKKANLHVRPASTLRFKIFSATEHDRLNVSGDVKYFNIGQNFTESTLMPVIEVSLIGDDNNLKVGDRLTLLTAQAKISQAGDWHFVLKQPQRYQWQLEELEHDGTYSVVLCLVSMNTPDNPDNPDNPDTPDTPMPTMGAFYDDGIDDGADLNTLRHYAALNGKHLGVALSSWKAGADEGARQFNMLVAENEMKMDALQPQRGEFSFGAADGLVTLAKNNGMTMRGHCLVWHMQQPQWLSSDGKKNDKNWSRTEALAIMKSHITAVMNHFKGQVTEWDVVNECLDDDQAIVRTNPEGYNLRPTVWQRAIGDDYIDSAFVYAHQADPTATLYLNDYDVEQQGTAKAVAFYNLIMKLRSNNIPVDGAGLQCHFSVGEIDSVMLDRTIRRFGEQGLKCSITELDMGIKATTANDLEEQARWYRIVTDIMLNNDNCPGMVIWGVKDNDSWRSDSSPLLYTAAETRKPSWYAVRSALRHRTLTTGIHPAAPTASPANAEDNAVYDLLGRRVALPLSAGIYIQGGRKIVVK